ncbi:MAG: CocE/NonD family hydrolase, partial [Dehalococcoidia bacterium]|nr:CocE/NonD family hydrolase [Dehalococcoidia bacterium]
MSSPADGEYEVVIERNVAVPMRDATVLRADVYRPAVDGRFPVLIERTPYDKTTSSESNLKAGEYYASHGYATVIQDVRGRFASEGEFYPFRDDGDGEKQDGYDTVEWAAEQPWSNGKVGTIGGSYSGSTQYRLLATQPPHLVAAFARQSSSDYFREWVYRDGALELGFNVKWALIHTATHARRLAPSGDEDEVEHAATRAAEDYEKWLEHVPVSPLPPVAGLQQWFSDWTDHPNHDAYWNEFNIVRTHDRVNVPVHHFGGWFDCF